MKPMKGLKAVKLFDRNLHRLHFMGFTHFIGFMSIGHVSDLVATGNFPAAIDITWTE
jgi:hypothetical protein